MTDIREQVARAIHPQLATHRETFSEAFIRQCLTQADAAIDAATPLIRAQVIEELAQKADNDNLWLASDEAEMYLADWLRAQADEPDDRKIYIGFKDKQKDKDRD